RCIYFQAEDSIRDRNVTGVQTCALPIYQLQDVAIALRDEIEAEEQKSANVERFLSVVERYTEIPELTPCILHEFVEKIVVHAAKIGRASCRESVWMSVVAVELGGERRDG